MDQEETIAALLSENEKLGQENDQLKWTLSLVKENHDLRGRRSFNNTLAELTVCSPSGRQSSGPGQTFDETHFRKHLQQTKLKHEHRTSSPVDFSSFVQSSMHTQASNNAKASSCKADTSPDAKALSVPDRVLGEIAYQLDRRILSHVFQGHRRLYGFTLLNIPEKIVEVSTHPLTGKVDEDYQLHLIKRHDDLMVQLNHFGYKATLHPAFVEFIVNTYGILKEKPDKYCNQATDYNNPDFLRNVIMTRAPRKLQQDLLLVLTCLWYMAEKDKKPLILW